MHSASFCESKDRLDDMPALREPMAEDGYLLLATS